MVRWDPVWAGQRELAERAALGFPPAVHAATVTGSATGVRRLLETARLPAATEVLGPVEVGADERAVLRVPAGHGLELADALRAAQGVRSARKEPEPVRVQIDPVELV
jgi:primosomal protein N' (replication factor Y)